MDGSADGAALIHTLVELGRTLGLVTLAEGIEKQPQLEGLRGESCDSGQGFIFSRPVEAAAIEALLSREPGDDTLRPRVPIAGSARSEDR
jgi:EAL domain-containing protein (putative c-di-GMP-specific phosphodiesterase class I)